MLAGEELGEAVRVARETTWDRHPDVNTWGAYQCYGDPGFRLQAPIEGGAGALSPAYVAPAELVADLDNLRSRVHVEILDAAAQSIEPPVPGDRVEALLRRVPAGEDWAARADVIAAIDAVRLAFEAR